MNVQMGQANNYELNIGMWNQMNNGINATKSEIRQIMGDDWDERIDY